MKAQNYLNNSDSWYDSEKLLLLSRKCLFRTHSLPAVSATEDLSPRLDQIKEDGQYFIPLNVNYFSQNFEEGANNHWVALCVVKENHQIVKVKYLDPMGKMINPTVASVVTANLGTSSIGQPLLGHPIQYTEEGSETLIDNSNDCGPLLIYAVSCNVYQVPCITTSSKEVSETLGQHLRKVFNNFLSADLQSITSGESDTSDRPLNETLFLGDIGGIYSKMGKDNLALRCHLRSLEIHSELFGEQHLFVARDLSNIGRIYNKISKHELSLEYHLKAFIIRSKCYDAESMEVAKSLSDTALAYACLHQYTMSLKCNMGSLEIKKKCVGENHLEIGYSLHNIGAVYGYLGYHTLALEQYKKSLMILKNHLGDTNSYVVSCKENIAGAFSNLGKYDHALAELAGLLSVLTKTNKTELVEYYKKRIEAVQGMKIECGNAKAILENGDKAKESAALLESKANSASKKTIKDYQSIKQSYEKAALLYTKALEKFSTIVHNELSLNTLQKLETVYTKLNKQEEVEAIKIAIGTRIDMITKAYQLSYEDDQCSIKIEDELLAITPLADQSEENQLREVENENDVPLSGVDVA